MKLLKIFIFVMATICFSIFGNKVFAQIDQLEQMKEKYENQAFEEVKPVLEKYISEHKYGRDDTKMIKSHILLALINLELYQYNEARKIVNTLLDFSPELNPRLIDYVSDELINLIDQVKKEREEQKQIKVTSTSKKEENLREAPATVIVLTKEELINRGYNDLVDFFKEIPGFDISIANGATYANIYQRGHRSNVTDRTLFLMDGFEVMDAWSQGLYWERQYPLSNVDRIEIVYGPASTIYGANALAGVVNIITQNQHKKDYNYTSVNAYTGYASYNTKVADITLSGKRNDISYSLTGRGFISDEMDWSIYPEFDFNPADYDTINIKYAKNLKFDYSTWTVKGATEAQKLDLIKNSGYFNLDTIKKFATPNSSGIAAARALDKKGLEMQLRGSKPSFSDNVEDCYFHGKLKIKDFSIGFNTWKQQQGSLNFFNDNYRVGPDNGGNWVPKQTFVYAIYDKELIDNTLFFTNQSQYKVSDVLSETESNQVRNYSNGALKGSNLVLNTDPSWNYYQTYVGAKQFRNETKLNYVRGKFDIIGGLEFRNTESDKDYYKKYNTYYYPDTVIYQAAVADTVPNVLTYNDYGVYTQVNYKFSSNLRFVVGSRLDYNKIEKKDGYGFQFNPRIASIYTLKKFSFKFLYARAFQDASVYTKYTSTASRVANPDIEPEEVNNFELSAGYSHNKNTYGDISFYRTIYNNITQTVKAEGGKTKNDALGQIKVFGIELNGRIKYGNLQGFANYSYTKAQDNIAINDTLTNNYQPVGDIAPHKINIGANYSLLKNRININLRSNFVGARPVGVGTSVPTNPQKGGEFEMYFLLNGTLSGEISKGVKMQLVCNNILDKEYFHPGVRSADGAVYAYRLPQQRRNFMIRLIIDFEKENFVFKQKK